MYKLLETPSLIEFRNVFTGSIEIKDKVYEFVYTQADDTKDWSFTPEDENTSYIEGILLDAIEDPYDSVQELFDQLNNE